MQEKYKELYNLVYNIMKNDRMGLLLACCKNCIGSVSVEPLELSENE